MAVIPGGRHEPSGAGSRSARGTHFGRIGLLDLVPRVAVAWKTRRGAVLAGADQVVAGLPRAPANRWVQVFWIGVSLI